MFTTAFFTVEAYIDAELKRKLEISAANEIDKQHIEADMCI